MANWVPSLGAHRITFTPPPIKAARTVTFLATEGFKAEAVRRTLELRPGSQIVPAALVRPTDSLVLDPRCGAAQTRRP